ncbi:MAG: hypothetical protein P0Y53_09205 [Candidatus Pseudobacter hemicellulosilyticus]|uniref:Uncharacterized protein n=1 Tax=Candidatus Pseudobacter hemicellulosilyticus TaxID=3121375 RepID=A0AAJ5WY80_9BACT|nr:MAG: hypothetical protein P0Y53_09205 [Pseudobacter sp.]
MSAKLDNPEYLNYMIRRKEEWDMYAIKEAARDDGIKEGRAEGMKIGASAALAAIALQMKLSKEPLEKIAGFTGLSAAAIAALE